MGAAKIRTIPKLSDAGKRFLCKLDTVVRPFILHDRDPIEFRALERDLDEGFICEKFLYGRMARYAMSYGWWQHAIQNDFTGS